VYTTRPALSVTHRIAMQTVIGDLQYVQYGLPLFLCDTIHHAIKPTLFVKINCIVRINQQIADIVVYDRKMMDLTCTISLVQ